MKEEPQILREKVTRGGSRWRCIWPELRERCGRGAVKEETGDASENKHAKMRRGGYEDAAGGLGGIRCKPGGWEGKVQTPQRWEVVVHLGGTEGRLGLRGLTRCH